MPRLESYLAGHGVGLADLVTPIAPTHRYDGQLSQDDGATDSGGDFFGAFHAKTDMAVKVSNSHKSLKGKRTE